MIAYFEKIVNSFNQPKTFLIGGNFLLVLVLILLSNSGVLPIVKFQDFLFFAVIFLIFALYRPGWAFLLFVGSIALENINLAPDVLKIAVRPYQFIGGIAFSAIIIRFAFKRSNLDLPKWKIVDWAVIVFASSGFLSVLGALDRGVSFKQSIIILSFAALYFLTRIFVQNLEDLKKAVPFFLSSGIAVVSYGIWQNVRFASGLEAFEAMSGRPNATFTEADWLGIYVVLFIAVLYAVIYFLNYAAENGERLISNDQFPISNQIQNSKFKIQNLFLVSCFLFLASAYVLLILTVSRSAWLGAVAVTVAYLLAIFTQLKLNPKEWQRKETLKIKIGILVSLAVAVGAVYFFNLTTFQLWNRAQSTGSGLQKITISCEKDITLPEKIASVSELEKYGCRHIDLENKLYEKMAGNFVKEIDRPDPNVGIRAKIYQKSWETIKAHPILGIGWGNSSLILGQDERGVGLNSSNIFLEAWLGSGILGLLSLVFIFGYAIVQSLRNFVRDNDGAKISGLFVLLGIIALLIPNLFNAGIFLGILWVFLGISASLSSVGDASHSG